MSAVHQQAGAAGWLKYVLKLFCPKLRPPAADPREAQRIAAELALARERQKLLILIAKTGIG